ncbi:cadherin-7-like [Sphaeramia orbicularis]|uniref:cadherin-7-like n=1 Tax=Sphaeramia orbicularis TaxID=375764 RepID=UPI00117D1E1D|nr:cadherin-7-like [Sphaeramia orbicularis]
MCLRAFRLSYVLPPVIQDDQRRGQGRTFERSSLYFAHPRSAPVAGNLTSHCGDNKAEAPPQQYQHTVGTRCVTADSDGVALSCGAVAYTSTGLSTGALLAILGCIITLLEDPAQIGKGITVITVLDINDNAPVFAIDYETLLCEHTMPGQVIQTISAVDKDEPLSGHRFYFALAAPVAGNLNFTLRDNKDNTASILTKRGGFRRREQPVYRLPVLIVDSGSPALSSTNTLSVRVCDCDSDGVALSCGAVAYTSTGLSTGALLAILGCIITLLVMVLLIVTMRRRRKEPLILEEERDIRENIVRYDDEGGGEEDTEAFDMVTLRNLNVIRDPNVRRDVTPDTPTFFHYPSAARPSYKSLPDNVVFREFIWERLKDADVDPSAPPYDSLQTYAFEGSGSVAESLSSLESLSTDSDQNYDYLSNWGPRFKKLADLYGNSDGTSVFS